MPITNELAGMSLVTNVPIPTTTFLPMDTPLATILPAPIKVQFPILTFPDMTTQGLRKQDSPMLESCETTTLLFKSVCAPMETRKSRLHMG